MFVSHAALAFAKIAWKTTKTHAWNAAHPLIVWIKKWLFSWQKRAFHVKHCRFWRGVLLSFFMVLNGFFVYFSPCFSIKTRIKVFCILDLILFFFFDVAARNVKSNVCFDNFRIVFLSWIIDVRAFYYYFRYNKNPPFRAVYYKRVSS